MRLRRNVRRTGLRIVEARQPRRLDARDKRKTERGAQTERTEARCLETMGHGSAID